MSSGSEHSFGDKDKAISSHYFTSGPQVAISNQPTVSVTETEEWTTRKKKDTVITKQIETRVKREIVINDDGEITEDSGPQIITDVTRNTKTETEEDFTHNVSGANKPGDKWSVLPNSVVVSDVKRTTNSKNESHEEKTETAVTEEVDGITREEIMRAIKQRDRDTLKSKHSSSNDSSPTYLKMSDTRNSLDKSDANVFQFKGQHFNNIHNSNNNNNWDVPNVKEDNFKKLHPERIQLSKSRSESPLKSHPTSPLFHVGDTFDEFGHSRRTNTKLDADQSSRILFDNDKYKASNRVYNHYVGNDDSEGVTLIDEVQNGDIFTNNHVNSSLPKTQYYRRQQNPELLSQISRSSPESRHNQDTKVIHQSHKTDIVNEKKIETRSAGDVSCNGFKVSQPLRSSPNMSPKGLLKESFTEQKFISDYRTIENEESRVSISPSSSLGKQYFQRQDPYLVERSTNLNSVPFNDTCVVHSRDKISIRNNGTSSPVERQLNNQYVLTISISSDGTIANSCLNNNINYRHSNS